MRNYVTAAAPRRSRK